MELSVKTSTGKEYEVRFAGSTVIGVTSVLYIEFIGKTMMDLIPVFSDPNETTVIYGYVEDELQKTFEGYTNLIEAIVLAESQNIRIALTAPIDALGE